MLTQPQCKYRPFPPVALADRQWPSRTITQPPIWLSTDLRDGNQALFEPMSVSRKHALFETLCRIGFKQIEVGFPAAAQTEFDFIRQLIEQQKIPADVTIGVLTQAREPLIRRSVEALVGARRAIVHVYNATAPVFREVVFGMSRDEVRAMAVSAVQLIRVLTDQHPETEWQLEYSPEVFSNTELEFAKQVCDAVTEAWGATPARRVILNLPATVEAATPNVYADQIEWMHRHLARRDSVIISVHPHNDRGTAVAAAELAQMAGAERVEGCLFGNGERTGNVDLVTLALNLYTQGIHPGLDFSDLPGIVHAAEVATQLPVHPRHPYAGDLVFTAFSGSHQDAIRKGFAAQQPEGEWRVPYLPIDPADIGRAYDSIIRVNSQSGKGGVAYLLESVYGVVMPRRMQIEFSTVVQRAVEASGGEIDAAGIWDLFNATYVAVEQPWQFRAQHLFEDGERQGVRVELQHEGQARTIQGVGNGPIDAVLHALASCSPGRPKNDLAPTGGGTGQRPGPGAQPSQPVKVVGYEERALGVGSDARALAVVEMRCENSGRTRYGVGLDANIVTASTRAVFAALNRLSTE